MNFCLPSRSCWTSAWWTSSRSSGGRAEETREVTTAASQHTALNKPKHLPGPTSSNGATPRSNGASRMLPASHHYDNNPKRVVAAPIYSTIEPRTELHSLSHSHYHLVSAEQPSLDDNNYEDLSSLLSDVISFCLPGAITSRTFPPSSSHMDAYKDLLDLKLKHSQV